MGFFLSPSDFRLLSHWLLGGDDAKSHLPKSLYPLCKLADSFLLVMQVKTMF